MNKVIFSKLPGLLSSGLLFFTLVVSVATARAEQVDNTAGNVSRGAVSWSQNCTRCHELRNPTEFRDDLWKPIVTHMRVRAGLTGQQQRDILAFLQASNNPAPLKVSAGKDSEAMAGAVLSGKEIYDRTCVACHGADGTGVMPGTPDLTAQGGPMSQSGEVLIQRITQGFQTPGSPMAMPAMGGNPNLSAEDVRLVLDYMRETFGPR